MCTELHPVYRRLLQLTLDELRVIEDHITQLDREMARLLHPYQPAVQRLAEVPGLGVDSAQQIIAEVGARAVTFPSSKHLASWVGACPGEEEPRLPFAVSAQPGQRSSRQPRVSLFEPPSYRSPQQKSRPSSSVDS